VVFSDASGRPHKLVLVSVDFWVAVAPVMTSLVQDKLLPRFRMGNTRQTNSAPFAQIKPTFDQDDLFQRVNPVSPVNS